MVTTMKMIDIIQRNPDPAPWAEGEKIPWNEPAFSARMLAEHLSQAHDAASRRAFLIDAQVDWIHQALLGGRVGRILDLGCGPGLYLERLARLGHACVGIDFSPASIAFARARAVELGLDIRYEEADVRSAAFGGGQDLVILIHGEFNVFRPNEARGIVGGARAALAPGGRLLIEYSRPEAVRRMGEGDPDWVSSGGGLMSPDPHLWLSDHIWHVTERIATNRHYVIDAATGAVTRHAESIKAWTQDELRALLEDGGFASVAFHPGLSGARDPDGLYDVVIATAPAAARRPEGTPARADAEKATQAPPKRSRRRAKDARLSRPRATSRRRGASCKPSPPSAARRRG